MRAAPSAPHDTSAHTPASGRILKTPEPGASLLQEAEDLVSRRQWRRAIKVLEAAQSVGSNNVRVYELMAVAANHAGKKLQRREAVDKLRGLENHTPSSALALARVALANNQFKSADTMARQALAADPYSAPAWNHLAASYCALGWFDEAGKCLDTANDTDDPTDRWYLGKAINHWAMSKTQTLLVTVIAVLLFGTIGLAVGLAVPMVTRELRVANLPQRFRDLASEEWKTEHRLRLLNAFAVLAIVLVALLIPTQ